MIKVIIFITFVFVTDLSYGKPEYGFSYCYSDSKVTLFHNKTKSISIYDLSNNEWGKISLEELNIENENRKTEIVENINYYYAIILNEISSLLILCINKANHNIDSRVEIKLDRIKYLSGAIFTENVLYIFTSPLVDKTIITKFENCTVTIIGQDRHYPGDVKVEKKVKMRSSTWEAFYTSNNFAMSWATYGKNSYGYIYDYKMQMYYDMPDVPIPQDRPPFGGYVPRSRFGHCFSGNRLFIIGGHLTWSSSIGIMEDGYGKYPGLCYSFDESKWEVLPEDSPFLMDYPKLCWTDKEVLFIDDKKVVDEILKNWKEKKPVDESIMMSVMNTALSKCTLMALQLSQDMNLPAPIKLPRITKKP